MNRWRLLIVAASAAAALVVGLGAHASPATQDIDLASLISFDVGG